MAAALVEYIHEAPDRNEAPHLVRICCSTGCSLQEGQDAMAQILTQDKDVHLLQLQIHRHDKEHTVYSAVLKLSIIQGPDEEAIDAIFWWRRRQSRTRDQSTSSSTKNQVQASPAGEPPTDSKPVTITATTSRETTVVLLALREVDPEETALADDRKYALKFDSVDRTIPLEHFLAKFNIIQKKYELNDTQVVRIFDDRLTSCGVLSFQDWWARRCCDSEPVSWVEAREAFQKDFIQKTLSRKMVVITDNPHRKSTETVREYARRIADASWDAGLQANRAVVMIINGCSDAEVAACLRGASVRPETIEISLDYLIERDVDIDRRTDGSRSAPQMTPVAPSTPTRSARNTSRTQSSSTPNGNLQELQSSISRLQREMTSLTTSNNDQFSSIQDVVAMISTDNPAGNNPGCPLNASKQSTMPAHVMPALQSCGRNHAAGCGVALAARMQMTSEDDNKQRLKHDGRYLPGVVRDAATIEPRTAPGLGDDTKNDRASQPPQTKGVPSSAYKDMQQEGGIQERSEDKLQTEATMLPPFDERHGPVRDRAPDLRDHGRILYTGPSAGDDSRRKTDGSEDKEEKGMCSEPCDKKKGMHVEPSNEESSCRQTKPNTRDASASPDGDSLAHQGAASVQSRTQPRVRGTLATFPEETSDAREPGAPSRDSRTRASPTTKGRNHADIARVVTTALKRSLTEADNILFDSPVDIDDPERWLDWFSTTLNTCEVARTANRNFEQERVAMVADTRPPGDRLGIPGGYRTPRPLCRRSDSPKEKGLNGGSDPTALTHLEGLDSGSAVIDPGIPHSCTKPRLRTGDTTRGSGRTLHGLDESGFTALLHSRTRDPYPLCGVMTESLAPPVLATIDGHSTQALVDTGASVTVISQEFWMLLGRTPSYRLVSAANAGISILGFRHCSVTLTGISTTFSVWVLEASVTLCILGVNLLRKLHSLVDLGRDQVCSAVAHASPLEETPRIVKKASHHKRLRVCDDSDDDDEEAEFMPTSKPVQQPVTTSLETVSHLAPPAPVLSSQPNEVANKDKPIHRPPPQKQQKEVSTTRINKQGYMVTETTYEDMEDDDDLPPTSPQAGPSSGKLPAPPPKKKRVVKASGSAKQSNLMDFFEKK
ncbi:hypothetical protein H257_17838 [Aphanomyces astaci]|uniref:Peptidase A2 domain-containing protein n=1 Tax=Aphanomyces astaci TaxID=112090 RepID=W4FFC1_APHAT|nr:hypothetical protein H257_17838 [Aphanomyces astaci]ETV65443.1 hypothetical protein H257_17838 [Aphanomyces astaci]|eukprot:XP_009845086.1 hypothetical protein H257_17838 [Aphanomyces astaci]